MQRTVLRTTEQLLGSEELFFFSFGQGKVREAFPEIIDRRDGGMETDMLEYRYDTQLLIDGDDLDEDEVAEYFTENFKGDCLLAVGGDGDPIKIHYHTNEPWKVLEYCRSLGEIYDIVVEDMDRQSRGLKG